MKYFKEKKHEKLNEIALDRAIENIIGPLGEYNYNIGRIDFFINANALKDLLYFDINLPCWEDVLNEAKKIYKNFDSKDIKKIIYRLEYIDIDNKICLIANDSDIKITNCNFGGIEIKQANNVEIFYSILNSNEECPIYINADLIEFIHLYESNNINIMDLNANSIFFDRTKLNCINANINMNATFICLEYSELYGANNIKLNAKCIDSDNSILEANNNIIINNEECGEIKGLDAKTIVYNGVDITNSIDTQKVRKELINKLEEIRKNIIKEINKYTKLYKEELNNSSISKVLKK